jgi:hypothetical protein
VRLLYYPPQQKALIKKDTPLILIMFLQVEDPKVLFTIELFQVKIQEVISSIILETTF